jgi:hypothetical protein
MISFITVSKRRLLVVDVSTKPSGYHMALLQQERFGYLSATVKVLTPKPVGWKEARVIATDYAKKTGQLVTYSEFQHISGNR